MFNTKKYDARLRAIESNFIEDIEKIKEELKEVSERVEDMAEFLLFLFFMFCAFFLISLGYMVGHYMS